jgi:hypothetical protein
MRTGSYGIEKVFQDHLVQVCCVAAQSVAAGSLYNLQKLGQTINLERCLHINAVIATSKRFTPIAILLELFEFSTNTQSSTTGLFVGRDTDMEFQKTLRFQIWAPFGFCMLLMLPQFLAGETQLPSYFVFFPMCFYGVAVAQLSLLRRIEAIDTGVRGNPDKDRVGILARP